MEVRHGGSSVSAGRFRRGVAAANITILPLPPKSPELNPVAIFNLLPLPPLDGGRIAVGVLPDALAVPLARLEPYGMMILIGVLFILPLLGAQLGIDLNVVWQLIQRSTNVIIEAILWLSGNT
jgi:hypothetical protein